MGVAPVADLNSLLGQGRPDLTGGSWTPSSINTPIPCNSVAVWHYNDDLAGQYPVAITIVQVLLSLTLVYLYQNRDGGEDAGALLVGIGGGTAGLDGSSFHGDPAVAGRQENALSVIKLDLIKSHMRGEDGQGDSAGSGAGHARVGFRLCVVERSGIIDGGGDCNAGLPARCAVVLGSVALFGVAELDGGGSDALTLGRGNGDGRTDEGGTDHRVLPGERGKLGH